MEYLGFRSAHLFGVQDTFMLIHQICINMLSVLAKDQAYHIIKVSLYNSSELTEFNRAQVSFFKKKAIRNLPGYFKGVLDKLVDETYFKDIFMLFDASVEGFYCHG